MPTIDLTFRIVGQTVPLDHGYGLFAALCRVVPQLHGDERVGVHPIRGRQTAPGVLSLTEASRLRLRLPSETLAPFIALAGARLDLDGHPLRVGIPRVEPLNPASILGARLVTFRHALGSATFESSVRRELSELGVAGEPSFVLSTRASWLGQPLRRVVKVRGKRIVGYSLRVSGLTAEESLRLQAHGLGGRRRFGCGVLTPITSTIRLRDQGSGVKPV